MTDLLVRLSEHVLPFTFRIGAYANQVLLDDPAMLALAFC